MAPQDSTTEKRKPRRWERGFLAALALTGNWTAAAKAAGVDRTTPHKLREQAPDFEAACERAKDEAADLLELEARRRAHDGWNEPVVYKGELSGTWVHRDGRPAEPHADGAQFIPLTVKKYSDTLLIFLLKGERPDKFKDRNETTHTGTVNLVHQYDDDFFAKPESGANAPADGASVTGAVQPGPDESGGVR